MAAIPKLSVTPTSTTLLVGVFQGRSPLVLPAASDTEAGVMSAADHVAMMRNGDASIILTDQASAVQATILVNDEAIELQEGGGPVARVSGLNTGDEDTASIKSKLGITTLSGSNTGDETTASIKSKLGITTLSGSNTGDQDLSGYGLKSGTLAQFASTTSAQLAGVISDETGTGVLVFATAPTISNPTFNQFSLSGNISAAAWTTNGIRIKGVAATFTDTTSTGTVATAYTNHLGGNTIAASNAVTFTNYVTTFIAEAVAGTNVTFTNKYALGAESARFGTSNFVTISSGGILTATNAVFVTPTLGTPASGNLSNCTSLPVSTGVSGLGTGVASLLAGTASGTGGPAGTSGPTIDSPVCTTKIVVTSGGPIIINNSGMVQFRNNANSADAPIQCGTGSAIGGTTTMGTVTGSTFTATSAFVVGSSGPTLRNSSGTIQFRNNANSADVDITCGAITASTTGKLGTYTVATLPSASTNAYAEANVSDSSVTTWGSTVAGSGSNKVKVRSNGTNWTVVGI